MAVPSFDEFFLPLLQLLNEKGPLRFADLKTELAERMGISEEDQRELLPSGKQRRYDNRVGWARTYLSKAGLLRNVTRGVYELSEEGEQLLASNPQTVNVITLQAFEPFQDWRSKSKSPSPSQEAAVLSRATEATGTPEETISSAYEELRQALAAEISETLQEVSWGRFEEIVIDVLLALGYGGSRAGAGHAFRKSGDGGVDGVINEDRLGLSKIYVQAKRKAPEYRVSRPDVQAFVGSLLGQRAKQGVFITTSSFSREAEAYAEGLSDLRVVLIDGEALATYMIDHDVGVSEQDRFVVKRIDRDYFEET